MNILRKYLAARLSLSLFVIITTTRVDSEASDTNADPSNSQSSVVQRFPEIGIAGSESNKKFLSAVADARQTRPNLFGEKDWPMQIAIETESLKSLIRSLSSKDSTIISKEAIAFKNSDKLAEKELNTLGLQLYKVYSQIQAHMRDWRSTAETATRLRKNAETNDHFVPFNPADMSNKLKAEALRNEAGELIAKFTEKTERLKEEEKNLQEKIFKTSKDVSDREDEKLKLIQEQEKEKDRLAIESERLTKEREKAEKNAPIIAPLQKQLNDLQGEYFNILNKYGTVKEFIITKKLSSENFPQLAELSKNIYQVRVPELGSDSKAILVSPYTQFISQGRAEVRCKTLNRISVVLENGFSEMATIYEQTRDSDVEARLVEMGTEIRKLKQQIYSLSH
jgi:DNA repair exonuclease SbcCD ATPase subunit